MIQNFGGDGFSHYGIWFELHQADFLWFELPQADLLHGLNLPIWFKLPQADFLHGVTGRLVGGMVDSTADGISREKGYM